MTLVLGVDSSGLGVLSADWRLLERRKGKTLASYAVNSPRVQRLRSGCIYF